MLTATASTRACVKRDTDQPCGRTPVARYAVGPVCSGHLVPGAEVYEWLNPLDGQAQLAAAVAGPGDPVAGAQLADDLSLPPAASTRLPRPERPAAAAHADAAHGEASTARLVAPTAGKIRARVLDHLIDAGPRGTTAIEAWHWYQATYSSTTERYSVAPRLSELVADGWAAKTGATRAVRGPGYPPEEVYVLSARGRREKGITW